MARPGITYQDVAAAIDKIIASGENPTIKRVRDALGTGSPNTILTHLTTWRDAAPVKERKAPELPAELQSAITKELARQAAESRSEVEDQLKQTKAESKELAQLGESLELEVDDLRDKNQALTDENLKLLALSEERKEEVNKLTDGLRQERDSSESARLKLAQELNKVELLTSRVNELLAAVLDKEKSLLKITADKNRFELDWSVAKAKFEVAEAQIKKLEVDLANSLEQSKERERELEKRIVDQAARLENKLAEMETKKDSIIATIEAKNDSLVAAIGVAKFESGELKGRLAEIEKHPPVLPLPDNNKT